MRVPEMRRGDHDRIVVPNANDAVRSIRPHSLLYCNPSSIIIPNPHVSVMNNTIDAYGDTQMLRYTRRQLRAIRERLLRRMLVSRPMQRATSSGTYLEDHEKVCARTATETRASSVTRPPSRTHLNVWHPATVYPHDSCMRFMQSRREGPKLGGEPDATLGLSASRVHRSCTPP